LCQVREADASLPAVSRGRDRKTRARHTVLHLREQITFFPGTAPQFFPETGKNEEKLQFHIDKRAIGFLGFHSCNDTVEFIQHRLNHRWYRRFLERDRHILVTDGVVREIRPRARHGVIGRERRVLREGKERDDAIKIGPVQRELGTRGPGRDDSRAIVEYDEMGVLPGSNVGPLIVNKDLQSAGNAGEYYTPRAVTQFMVGRAISFVIDRKSDLPRGKNLEQANDVLEKFRALLEVVA